MLRDYLGCETYQNEKGRRASPAFFDWHLGVVQRLRA